MYKVQEACDNCYHCSFVGYIEVCGNKEASKYNKEVDVAGICEHFKKGIYWKELENEKIEK